MRHASAALLLLAPLSLCGCGYALVGRVSNLPEDIQTVYVRPLENRTTRSQVEQILTQAIANELVTRQRLRIANELAAADSELGGTVTAFGVTPVTFDEAGRATSYEISISAQMVFKRVGDEEIIWSRDHYQFRQNYVIDISETGYFDRENIALEDVSEEFAETLVTDLLEGF